MIGSVCRGSVSRGGACSGEWGDVLIRCVCRASDLSVRSVRWFFLIALLPLVAAVCQGQTRVPALDQALGSAKRVVFLGDSITYRGEYVAIVEMNLRSIGALAKPPLVINMGLSSETVSGLSEEGHAGGRFPRPGLSERLDRVLDTAKPEFVFACYGMNCGIYKPVSTERFAAFQNGIRQVQAKLADRGIPLVLITPVSFDGQVAQAKGHPYWQYDRTLSAYSEWLVSLRAEGQWVIDLHSCFIEELTRRRRADPGFTFQRDAVHPTAEGHQVIARCVTDWLRQNGVGSVVTDAESISPDRMPLMRQKMQVLRDAYLHAAGHQRPGVKTGLPIDEAIQAVQALEIEMTATSIAPTFIAPGKKP